METKDSNPMAWLWNYGTQPLYICGFYTLDKNERKETTELHEAVVVINIFAHVISTKQIMTIIHGNRLILPFHKFNNIKFH